MHRERVHNEAERRIGAVLATAVPVLLTLAGVWFAWRFNQARQARARHRLYVNAVSGPTESLPHVDPDEDLVDAASEDSFPASDPPSYTAGERPGSPAH